MYNGYVRRSSKADRRFFICERRTQLGAPFTLSGEEIPLLDVLQGHGLAHHDFGDQLLDVLDALDVHIAHLVVQCFVIHDGVNGQSPEIIVLHLLGVHGDDAASVHLPGVPVDVDLHQGGGVAVVGDVGVGEVAGAVDHQGVAHVLDGLDGMGVVAQDDICAQVGEEGVPLGLELVSLMAELGAHVGHDHDEIRAGFLCTGEVLHVSGC